MSRSITQTDMFNNPRQELLMAEAAVMAKLWSRTKMLAEVHEIVRAVTAWPCVKITPDRTGLCLKLGNQTLGRLRWNGQIDLPFGPEVLDQVMAEWMVDRDPDQPDRVIFAVRDMADVDRAIWILRLAYLIADSKVDVCRGGRIGRAEPGYDEHPESASDRDFVRDRPTYAG